MKMLKNSNTLGDLYAHMLHTFRQAKVETPDLDARLIIQARTGFEWADMVARPDLQVNPGPLAQIESDVARRLAGEPVSRIHGQRQFWGLDFKISPDVLDPRPDTETLVEAALVRFRGAPPARILDLGTGSGCILITLLSVWKSAQGTGVDQSSEALEIARGNAVAHGVDQRCSFYCGSWFEPLNEAGKVDKFDFIVSNPPYISNQIIPNLAPEVRNHDPILALDGGADGLDEYKKIFFQLFLWLSPCGKAFFEIGYDQEKDVMRLAEESGFSVEHVHRDLAGLPRVVEISRGDK